MSASPTGNDPARACPADVPTEAETVPPAPAPPTDPYATRPPQDAYATRSGTDLQVPPEPPDADRPGVARVAGYEVLGVLGRGGMGVVYRARQARLNREVALKMILAGDHAGDDERRRFLTEAEAVARLHHPNIVQIHEIGEADGQPFFSLEFCPGGSLAGKLDGTPLPPAAAARLVETLARAVQAAHHAGIVHRDLKPANVLLDADGTPKITDFGLAKKLDDAAGPTASGAIMGTPSYMAPEQAGGKTKEIGPAADVYALGAILYELLTGRPPFKAATSLDTVLQVVSDEPVPPARLQPKVPRDLETVCLKCLHKEPGKRYASALALADDLRRFQSGEAIAARPVGRLERAGKWVRRNRAVSAAAAGVAAALLAGSVVATYFGLVATGEAARADQEARAARREAEHALQEQRVAEANRAKADAAEQEQKRLSAGALRANARLEARADDPAAALPLLALAHRVHPDPHYETQVAGLLPQLPRPVLLGRHAQGVNHLAVSPDGARVVSGANDGTVRLWDVESGAAVGEPARFPGPVFAVAFSADGSEFAAGGGTYLSPGKVARFATADGRRLADLPELPGTPIYVGYTADGRLITGELRLGSGVADLITGSFGKTTFTLRLHDRAGGKLPRGYEMDAWGEPSVRTLSAVVAAGHGRVLAQDGKAARVLDLATRQPVAGFEFVGDRRLAALSADGRFAVLVGNDAVARVWDLDRGKTYAVPLGRSWAARAVAVDERGQLAVAFHDGWVQRYTLADGQPVPRSDGKVGEPGWEPQFSADGAYVAAERGGVVQVWRTDDRQPVCPPLRHGASVTALRELAAGRRWAVGATDGTVRVWDLATDQRPAFRVQTNFPARTDFHLRPAESVDLRFLADGRLAVAGGGGRWVEDPARLRGRRDKPSTTAIDPAVLTTAVTDDGARVFSGTTTGELRLTGAGPLKHANKVLIHVEPSADGRYVATVDVAGTGLPAAVLGNCQVWDTATGKRVLGPFPSSFTGGAISAAAVHGGAGRAAVARGFPNPGGGFRCEVQLYDLATGRPSGSPLPLGPQMVANALAFSPDGRRLAVSGEMVPSGGGEVAVWDVGTGRPVVPAVRLSGTPQSGGFSPDGRWLAVVTRYRVLLFDPAADRPPAELVHPKEVQFARFSPDGSVLVTAGADQVFLWDPATQSLIRPPLQHDRDSAVVSAAVSPDGRYAAAINNGGVLMGWQIAGGRLDPDATARLVRLLSCTAVGRDELVPATAGQLEEDWAALRRDHPDELRPAADVAAEWHAAQFNAAVQARRFGSAGRHLEAAWPTYPGEGDRFVTGACYLAAGDRDGVRRAFAELARLADHDPTPLILTHVVEIGLHDGEALTPAERDRAIALGDKLPRPGPKREWYFVLARALALTRAGRLEEAEREVALVQKVDAKIVKARADAQLAVIRRLQGRTEDAKKLADAAAAELTRLESGGLTNDWMNAIFLRRLVDEARRPPAKE